MWDAWGSGDRKGAVAAISDELIDELFIHGSPRRCRERLQEYVDAGVDTPVVLFMPWGISESDALWALGFAQPSRRDRSSAARASAGTPSPSEAK